MDFDNIDFTDSGSSSSYDINSGYEADNTPNRNCFLSHSISHPAFDISSWLPSNSNDSYLKHQLNYDAIQISSIGAYDPGGVGGSLPLPPQHQQQKQQPGNRSPRSKSPRFHSQDTASHQTHPTYLLNRTSTGRMSNRSNPNNKLNNHFSAPRMPNSYMQQQASGGSNAQGRAINKILLEILHERFIDSQRLDLAIESYCERMDCVNLATLLFHTGKKRMILLPCYVSRIAKRFNLVKEKLRSREASNALYGLKVMSSELPEVRELVLALATKISASSSQFVAQAVGNALYGLQMMTSEHEEVRYLLYVLSSKVFQCIELLEAQNVGNALYGLKGMNSDYKEVRSLINALTPKIATAREDLNGQALGNSLYGLQNMSSKESEVRLLLAVLATKVSHSWEDLKAQEIGNALYGLKRMSSDVPEVRILMAALITKIAKSSELLDAQAIGNSLYGLQNMTSNSPEVLSLLTVLAEKLVKSFAELDGQAMGNSMYGLQGMSSEYPEVRAMIAALSSKISSSGLDINAQELGNSLYGLQSMSGEHGEVRRLLTVLTQKLLSCKQELSSQEIGNVMFGLQNMCSSYLEIRMLVRQIAVKIEQSHAILDPQCVSMCLFGLQHMSTECDDVRLLVLAIATKIEHSWKLLSAQQLSLGIYGLQSMSSSEIEVRYLVKSLVAKVMSCRDEMTARQLGYLFLGLQHLSSDHSEVLLLITALTEKISQSSDQWTMSTLAMVLFGVQGFSTSHDEVGSLLSAIAVKAINLCAEEKAAAGDGILLANSFFGLQRMSTDNASMRKLLKVLSSRLALYSVSYKVEPSICANIVYGLQNCSCSFDEVKAILYLVADFVERIASSSSSTIDLSLSRYAKGVEDNIYPNLTTIDSHQLSEHEVNELLVLSQTLTLSIFTLRDLECDNVLKMRLNDGLVSLHRILTQHESELTSRQLTYPERRMAMEVGEMLYNEPFVVKTGVFVMGFFMTVFIQPSSKSASKTFSSTTSSSSKSSVLSQSSTPSSSQLNIEVLGSSYKYPCKELFFRLRRNYLETKGRIKVEYVSAESFRHGNHHGTMRIHPEVLLPLYTEIPNDEPLSKDYSKTLNCPSVSFSSSTSSSDSFLTSGTARSGSWDGIASAGPMEYLDDDFVSTADAIGLGKKTGVRAPYAPKLPLGMNLTWLGDWPVIDKSQFTPAHPVSHQINTSVASHSPGHSSSEHNLSMERVSLHSISLTNRDSMNSCSTSMASDSSGSPLHSNRKVFNHHNYDNGGARNSSVSYDRMSINTQHNNNRAHMEQHHFNSYCGMHDFPIIHKGNSEAMLLASRSMDTMLDRQGKTLVGRSVADHSIAFDSNNILLSRASGNESTITIPTKLDHASLSNNYNVAANSTPFSMSLSSKHLVSSKPSDVSQSSADSDFAQELQRPPGYLSPCTVSSADNDDIDDELAALEAQLEVARLEAKIKALKAKKKQAK